MSFLTFAQLTISTSMPFIFVSGVLSLGMIASVTGHLRYPAYVVAWLIISLFVKSVLTSGRT